MPCSAALYVRVVKFGAPGESLGTAARESEYACQTRDAALARASMYVWKIGVCVEMEADFETRIARAATQL